VTPAWALIHGFTGTPRNWDPVIEHLPPGTVTSVPSLLGHSPKTQDCNVSTFEQEVDRLALDLSQAGRRLCICGYSLGGRLALGLLVRHPYLFDRGVLVSAHPGLTSDVAREQRARSDAEWCALLEGQGIEAFVDLWQRLPLFASQEALPAAARARQREERLSHDARGLSLSLRATGLARMPAYLDALGSVRVPITLIAGEHDLKFRDLAGLMHQRLPSSRVVVVENAGHNVVLEAPAALAKELAS
jgi:2-succinyl-6-hydroxy-2,4-cyclohexadiene-1-carboxylate synthase